jgi:hypothetical protein
MLQYLSLFRTLMVLLSIVTYDFSVDFLHYHSSACHCKVVFFYWTNSQDWRHYSNSALTHVHAISPLSTKTELRICCSCLATLDIWLHSLWKFPQPIQSLTIKLRILEVWGVWGSQSWCVNVVSYSSNTAPVHSAIAPVYQLLFKIDIDTDYSIYWKHSETTHRKKWYIWTVNDDAAWCVRRIFSLHVGIFHIVFLMGM